MTWTFFPPCVIWKWRRRKKKSTKDINIFKHICKQVQAHAETQRRHCQGAVSGQPARNCWHIRKSETHTPSGVCGEGFFFLSADRVTKVDALGKHLWQGMLWAVTHSLDSWPRVASGGWMSRRRGRRGSRRAQGAGLKKQSLGFGGRSGACSFPLSLRAGLFFPARTRRCADVDAMSADRTQEASACLF